MQYERSNDVEKLLRRHEQARLVDASNLPKPRWRDVLAALVSPATRMHQYRNLRAEMFNDAADDLDCGKRR